MTKEFAVDNISILFLARMCRTHTNTFRFSMTLKEPIQPQLLQTAVDRIWKRFPTIIAGFRPGFFQYTQFAAKQPPQVQPDPGCLITMSLEEIHNCAFRVYYQNCIISIEAFHALTDGYGALICFTTLVAEYLRLLYDIHIPVEHPLVNLSDEPFESETVDDCLTHQEGKPKLLPKRYSYQLPNDSQKSWQVSSTAHRYPIQTVLDAAHRYGVSANSLITAVMASSIMEIQGHHGKLSKPVRIMVPVDLRRIFGSKTLRNFSLYTLPAMEPEDRNLKMGDLMKKIQQQIRDQATRKTMGSLLAYTVRTQTNALFRLIPRALKFSVLRIGYRFFGECNSSITVTNLGKLRLPEEMKPYVEHSQVVMTPRTNSPYGCSIISYGDELTINICTFRRQSELDHIFARNMEQVLS